MHRRVLIAAAWAGLLIGAVALAQPPQKGGHFRYKWVDAQGQAHYSDSLSDEAIRRGYDVVNNQGMVVRHVDRPLTAAERKAAEARQEAAAVAEQKRQQQASADQRLLAAYPTEADFAASQQAELDNLTQAIRTTRMNLRSQEENLSELLSHAANIQAGGDHVPHALSKRIAEQRASVTDQRATLKHQVEEREQAEQAVQKRLAHYRQLKARQQQATADGP
jgi:hypothetical protein